MYIVSRAALSSEVSLTPDALVRYIASYRVVAPCVTAKQRKALLMHPVVIVVCVTRDLCSAPEQQFHQQSEDRARMAPSSC